MKVSRLLRMFVAANTRWPTKTSSVFELTEYFERPILLTPIVSGNKKSHQ